MFAASVNETAEATLPDRSDSGIFFDWMIFNLRDQIRDKESEPLQFKYIPAHCRLYYKLSNVYNMPNLWHDVANANWNDQSLCVPGSTSAADTPIDPPPLTEITITLPLVNWAVNDTDLDSVISDSGGIQDGVSKIQGMTSCSGTCSCQEISLRCQKTPNVAKPVSVCLQKCTINTSNICQVGTYCEATGVAVSSDTKALGVEKKSVSTSTGHKKDVYGVCRPGGTFIQKNGQFGCPL